MIFVLMIQFDARSILRSPVRPHALDRKNRRAQLSDQRNEFLEWSEVWQVCSKFICNMSFSNLHAVFGTFPEMFAFFQCILYSDLEV